MSSPLPAFILLIGDAKDCLRKMKAESVQCVVTSPPYYRLRDYGTAQWDGGDPHCDHRAPDEAGKTRKPSAGQREHAGRFAGDKCWRCDATRIDSQIGLERTPDEYVARLVEVFRDVRRVLRKDGVCWLNLGDSYANDTKWGGTTGDKHASGVHGDPIGRGKRSTSLKPKDLIGIPWRAAFALQADGWWLRQDIIWHKPNPMPESVKDRCTRSHEYVFLLTKSAKYWYDAAAVNEMTVNTPTGNTWGQRKADGAPMRTGMKHYSTSLGVPENGRNKRSVWTIATRPYPRAHFATFPPDLVRPMILASSRPGDWVLDPFAGSGTVLAVAHEESRRGIGIELKSEYGELAKERLAKSGMNMNNLLTDTIKGASLTKPTSPQPPPQATIQTDKGD